MITMDRGMVWFHLLDATELAPKKCLMRRIPTNYEEKLKLESGPRGPIPSGGRAWRIWIWMTKVLAYQFARKSLL